MGHNDDIGLGLLWFVNDQACYCFDATRPHGEKMEEPHKLLSDHHYLTNLTYEGHRDFVKKRPELASVLCMETTMIISTRLLAEEIGLPKRPAENDPEPFVAVLRTLYTTFQHICRRSGIDPLTMKFTTAGIREFIFYQTTNGAIRNVTTEEVNEGLSVKPHRWIDTGTPMPSEGAFRRRLTISRSDLYLSLLAAPTPVGNWIEGDPAASVATMLGARSDSTDILVRGRLSDVPHLGFPDVVTTREPRKYFTGEEIAFLADTDRELEVLGWWHGPISSPPALPEVQSMSLADHLLLEIMHRSWRENRGTGFWLAAAERIRLHHVAKGLHDMGIPVSGYGTGKITIITPEDEQARHEQDEMILKHFNQYGLQLPLDKLGNHPRLASLLDYVTDLQAVALAGPTHLAELDHAITDGDNERFTKCIQAVEDSLNARIEKASEVAS